MYAIRVLQSHGMSVSVLQQVFHAVVISKLTYSSPAWWGFITSTDRQRIITRFSPTTNRLTLRCILVDKD